MRSRAGDGVDRYIVGAGLKGDAVIVVQDRHVRNGNIRALANVKSICVLGCVVRLGGGVHTQLIENDVGRSSLNRVENIGRVLLSEVTELQVVAACDIQKCGAAVAAVTGEDVPSRFGVSDGCCTLNTVLLLA